MKNSQQFTVQKEEEQQIGYISTGTPAIQVSGVNKKNMFSVQIRNT